jgi:hypothetical protein
VSDDKNIAEVLRAAGHPEAAEVVEKAQWQANRTAAEGAPGAKPGEVKPAGISALSDDAFAGGDARRAEGESLLQAMRASGIGGSVSGGSLLGGDR